ncbi:hypothetical protein WKY82_10320 [Gordonia malaquae]|uniref:hypothetical protein n=1 Tax=Gordonia malaquae TaxID=410332 RepID=UPI0030C799F6
MVTQNTRAVKVSFFYLTDLVTGDPAPDVDWNAELKNLTAPYEHDYGGRPLQGIYVPGSYPCISIAIDRPFAPRQRNVANGNRSALPLSRGHEPIEETFVVFCPNGIIGILRSSGSAPHPAAVAVWLTARFHGPDPSDGDSRWGIEPLIHPNTLRQISEVEPSRLTLRVPAENAGLLSEGAYYRQFLSGVFGLQRGMHLEITISARRGDVGVDSRHQLHDALESALPDLEVFDKAVLVAARPGEASKEPINLLKDRMATKVVIPVKDRALDIASVIASIVTAYNDHRDELDAAKP